MAVEAFGAWWGGIPCALEGSPPRYRRMRGLEAATAVVTVPRRFFTLSLAPEVPPDPFRLRELVLPSDELVRMHEPAPVRFAPIGRPPYVGDLVVAQGAVGAPLRTFVARQMYLADSRIVDPQNRAEEDGSGGPLVELTLASIVRFWQDYGEITRSWNAGLAKSQAVVVGPDGQPRVRPDDRVYVAQTARERGTRPVPLHQIVQDLLRALPGKLPLVAWPFAAEDEEQVYEVHAWGASPKVVLAAVLDAAQLVIDVGEDLNVRAFRVGAGDVGERAGGGLAAHDPQTGEGAWAGAITADGDRYTRRPSHRPREVVVIGDRTVYEVAVEGLTPVLCVDAERPDGPPRRLVVEVTPDNMQAFARGTLLSGNTTEPGAILRTTPSEKDRLRMILGLAVPQVQDARELELPEGAQVGPDAQALPADDGHLWQRLPLASEDTWAASLPYLSERVRTTLRDQLWRYYQVPETHRRLLPILNRAARDYKGDRLPPKCEAFGYRAVSVRVPVRREADAEARPNASGTPNELRLQQVSRLESIQSNIAWCEAQLKYLEGSSLAEVHDGLIRGIQGGWAYLFGASTKAELDADMKALEAALEPTLDKWARKGSSWYQALAGGAEHFGFGSLSVFLKSMAGDTQEQAGVMRQSLEQALRDLRAEERRLIGELNPRLAKETELGQVEAQIATAYAGGGVPSIELQNRRDELRAEIRELANKKEEDVAQGKDRHPDEPEWQEVILHVPLARHEVPFRVVDEALGIIEVLSDSLPGWLADALTPDPKGTWFIPMPVKLTFGSWNRLDLEGRSGGVRGNGYVETSLRMLARDFSGVAPFVADLGDRLPATQGEEQIRFTFTREDQESGRAPVGEFPWRILYDDPENPLRRLVLLPPANREATRDLIRRLSDPSSLTTDEISNRQQRALELLPTTFAFDNWEELLARARPVAKAALAPPDELDSGSLVVVGPRAAALSGRVSAMEIRLRDVSEGFETEVSFASDAAPLPGVEGPVRQEGPVRLMFGIDVEGGRQE